METKPRFRPSLRQYRILEAANKELKEELRAERHNADIVSDGAKQWEFYWGKQCEISKSFKKNGDRAIRLNWYLIALIVALNIFLMLR